MPEDSLHSSTLTSNHLPGMILLDLFGGEASIVFPTPRFPPSGNTSAGSSLPKIYGIEYDGTSVRIRAPIPMIPLHYRVLMACNKYFWNFCWFRQFGQKLKRSLQ